jgi:hypothetical protein
LVLAPLAVERVIVGHAFGLEPEFAQARAQFQQLLAAFDEEGFGGQMVFAGDMGCAKAGVEIVWQAGEAAGAMGFDELLNAVIFFQSRVAHGTGLRRSLGAENGVGTIGTDDSTGQAFEKTASLHSGMVWKRSADARWGAE